MSSQDLDEEFEFGNMYDMVPDRGKSSDGKITVHFVKFPERKAHFILNI